MELQLPKTKKQLTIIKKPLEICKEDKPYIKNIFAFSETNNFNELYLEWAIVGKSNEFDFNLDYYSNGVFYGKDNELAMQCVCGNKGTNGNGLKYAVIAWNYKTDKTVFLGRICQKFIEDCGLKTINKNYINYNTNGSKCVYESILKNGFYTNQFGDEYNTNGVLIRKNRNKNLIKVPLYKKEINKKYKNFVSLKKIQQFNEKKTMEQKKIKCEKQKKIKQAILENLKDGVYFEDTVNIATKKMVFRQNSLIHNVIKKYCKTHSTTIDYNFKEFKQPTDYIEMKLVNSTIVFKYVVVINL